MEGQSTLHLEILTPEKKLIDRAVRFVAAPGSEGEFGVLPGHTDFFTLLKSGEVAYEGADGGRHLVAVSWGYAQVKAESVSILVENAEKAEEIDLERAKKDLERWETEFAGVTPEERNFEIFRAKIERAKARIEVAQHAAHK